MHFMGQSMLIPAVLRNLALPQQVLKQHQHVADNPCRSVYSPALAGVLERLTLVA